MPSYFKATKDMVVTLEIILSRLSRKKLGYDCENRFLSDQAKIRNISSEKRPRTYLVIKPTSDFKPKYSELSMENSTLCLRITGFFSDSILKKFENSHTNCGISGQEKMSLQNVCPK